MASIKRNTQMRLCLIHKGYGPLSLSLSHLSMSVMISLS